MSETAKVYTAEDMQAHIEKYLSEIMANFEKDPEAMKFASFPTLIAKLRDVWTSGCWLNYVLQNELGADEQTAYGISFCHGQRGAFGDPYKWALRYVNEYAQNGCIQDRPGANVSDKILKVVKQN